MDREICNMDNILQTGTLPFYIHSMEIHSNLSYLQNILQVNKLYNYSSNEMNWSISSSIQMKHNNYSGLCPTIL